MFIRKLFKISDKAKWLLLELLVVFFGVYLAFLFQSHSEDTKIGKEREKVLISLKLELENFRTSFPRFGNYQRNKNKEWDSLFDAGETARYYNWRYLEPQYNFRVIEYALNQNGTDIVDFALYEKLSNLYGRIKQLEHAERLMTEFGGKHKLVPSQLKENSVERALLEAENRFNFYKFLSYGRDRGNTMMDIADFSEGILKDINRELGSDKKREVEVQMMRRYFEAGYDNDLLWKLCQDYFPEYSKSEFDDIILEFQNNPSNGELQ